MKHKGRGSKVSPITIDDSEEEVVLDLSDFNVTNAGPTTRSQSVKDQEELLQSLRLHHGSIINGNIRQKDKDIQGKTICYPTPRN
jgi:hypothetical protein